MSDAPDEKTQIAKILEGDEKAKDWLVSAYRQRLYAACVHFLGFKDPEAEDVLQQTYLITLEKLSSFEGRSSLFTWMAHICINLCYERLRTRDRQVLSAQEDLDFLITPASVKQSDEAEAAETRKKRRQLVSQAMEKMEEKCRRILQLRDVVGMSYGRIGDMLKVPMGTVMSRLARCRGLLKEKVLKSLKGVLA